MGNSKDLDLDEDEPGEFMFSKIDKKLETLKKLTTVNSYIAIIDKILPHNKQGGSGQLETQRTPYIFTTLVNKMASLKTRIEGSHIEVGLGLLKLTNSPQANL